MALLERIREMYADKQAITMVTAYDHPSATHVDKSRVDICLVGDSVGMVVHGHQTTQEVTMDLMLLHCKAVSRGAKRCLLVGDLPFGSYETCDQAVENASKLVGDGGMHAVKLEGGGPSSLAAAEAVTRAGIPVMGHVGLTPQSVSDPSGFRAQGCDAVGAIEIMHQARGLQDAGCFALVLECIPFELAKAITSELQIPTIGIGAGPYCSGQVLVYHDLLGFSKTSVPRFCRRFSEVGSVIQQGLDKFCGDVSSGAFPTEAHGYRFKLGQRDEFWKKQQGQKPRFSAIKHTRIASLSRGLPFVKAFIK